MVTKPKFWTGSRKKLNQNESLLTKLNHHTLTLTLGNFHNKFVISQLSPWTNTFIKDSRLTSQYYVYDATLFKPDQPTSTARKTIGQGELITLGSIRNRLYFGPTYHPHQPLAPEHLQLTLIRSTMLLTSLTDLPTTIIRKST